MQLPCRDSDTDLVDKKQANGVQSLPMVLPVMSLSNGSPSMTPHKPASRYTVPFFSLIEDEMYRLSVKACLLTVVTLGKSKSMM